MTRIVAGRAWQAGWYHDRAPIQRIAVGVALTIGLLGVAMAAAAARRLGAALVAASVATALLLAIAALRVISLHATDHLLRVGWGPVTVSRAIEAGALAIVLVAAGMAARASARR